MEASQKHLYLRTPSRGGWLTDAIADLRDCDAGSLAERRRRPLLQGAKQSAKYSQGKWWVSGKKEERPACHGKMWLRIMSEKILKEPWPYIDPKLLRCGTSYVLTVRGLHQSDFFLWRRNRSENVTVQLVQSWEHPWPPYCSSQLFPTPPLPAALRPPHSPLQNHAEKEAWENTSVKSPCKQMVLSDLLEPTVFRKS